MLPMMMTPTMMVTTKCDVYEEDNDDSACDIEKGWEER